MCARFVVVFDGDSHQIEVDTHCRTMVDDAALQAARRVDPDVKSVRRLGEYAFQADDSPQFIIVPR